MADPLLLATDVVDYLVNKGVPFRNAHHVVGALVGLSEKMELPLDQLPYVKVSAIHEALAEDWTEVFDLQKALAGRERPGMPGRSKSPPVSPFGALSVLFRLISMRSL